MPPFNLSRIKNRIAQSVSAPGPDGGGGAGTPITVEWNQITGGFLNHLGALVSGVETPLSGVMSALAVEAVPTYALRQYSEIQVGDMILDTGPDPVVQLFAGQPVSGCVPLASLGSQGLRFSIDGRVYVQAKIGATLADLWALTSSGVPLMGGLLLRKET